MTTAVDTIIHARWLVPVVPRNIVLENHALVIQAGNILDMLPSEETAKKYRAKKVLNKKTHVLMPGLINMHTHTPMNLFRGLADDLPLMDWLNNHIWPAEAKTINAKTSYEGSRQAITEMLRSGTTCFNDHYFFPLETAQAALDAGMRASLGLVIMNIPNQWAANEDEYIAKAKAVYDHRPTSDLISWTVAPQGPYTNSDRSLSMAKQFAEDHHLRMHMHLHETKAELDIDLKNHGVHPIARLDKLGLLDNKFMAVHMVHVTDDELALCADRKVHIIHSPESNLKLASGFAPIVAYQKSGINVALGTDGAASNNDLDMFGELRTAALIAKAVNEDPTVCDAMTTLEMATINGAKALGLAHKIGSLEAGKAADVIAIDFDHPFTTPVFNPISHLVYAVNSLQVDDVFVDGKHLLKEGKFATL